MSDRAFEEACSNLGLQNKQPLFKKYLDLLMDYNQRVNLVGRQQSLDRLYHHHLLDCLLPIPLLNTKLTVCDVGTGAGFPGLCWALACDELQITLVEKIQKKAIFLTAVVEELKLSHRVTVLSDRVELVSLKADLITCRAVTQIAEFMKLTQHLGHKNSEWWLLKAKEETIQLELADLNTQRWSVNVVPLHHPTQDVTRNLVQITRAN